MPANSLTNRLLEVLADEAEVLLRPGIGKVEERFRTTQVTFEALCNTDLKTYGVRDHGLNDAGRKSYEIVSHYLGILNTLYGTRTTATS